MPVGQAPLRAKAAMRLVACLTMCLTPILAAVAQTDAQAPSEPQAYGVDRSADFYPYTGEPSKAAINSDRAIAEKLTGAWLPCQERAVRCNGRHGRITV